MKFLCLGYYDQEKMDARPKIEVDAVMRDCELHMTKFYGSGKIVMDAGISREIRCLRRIAAELNVSDAFSMAPERTIGSAFVIEANGMDDAVQVASLHPTTQLSAGERLGWFIEIHPIPYFKMESADRSVPVHDRTRI